MLILGVVIIVEDVFCGKQILGEFWSQVSLRKSVISASDQAGFFSSSNTEAKKERSERIWESLFGVKL